MIEKEEEATRNGGFFLLIIFFSSCLFLTIHLIFFFMAYILMWYGPFNNVNIKEIIMLRAEVRNDKLSIVYTGDIRSDGEPSNDIANPNSDFDPARKEKINDVFRQIEELSMELATLLDKGVYNINGINWV